MSRPLCLPFQTRSLQVSAGYPADVIRFFPPATCHDNVHFFVCGTYKLLDGATQQKTGKILFGSVSEDARTGSLQIERQHEVASEAVLDLKFLDHGSRPVLIAADAKGQLTAYVLVETRALESVEKQGVWRVGAKEHQFMYLSLDLGAERSVLASRSDGRLDYWKHTADALALQPAASWIAHEYDAWVCRFDVHQPSLLYSGGDDGLLKLWDVRKDIGQPSLTLCSKWHEAGVTAIESHPREPFVFCSGSYDQRAHVWDCRAMRRPLFSSMPGRGGVWRLVWHPTNKSRLLAACMHGGLSVYSYESMERLASIYDYAEHASIVYGADWIESTVLAGHMLIASCSFYDEAMHFHYFADAV